MVVDAMSLSSAVASGNLKQYLTAKQARQGLSYEKCVAFAIVAGALVGRSLKAAEAGGVLGAVVCADLADTGKDKDRDKDTDSGKDNNEPEREPKKPRDEPDGSIVDPRHLEWKEPLSQSKVTAIKSFAPFGAGVSAMLQKPEKTLGEKIRDVSAIANARREVVLARLALAGANSKNDLKGSDRSTVVAGTNVLTASGAEAKAGEGDQFSVSDANIPVYSSDDPEKVVGEIPDGHLITFPEGSAAYAKFPNGLKLGVDVEDPWTLMRLLMSADKSLNALDPANPSKSALK